jgi:hypothetical protein
MIKPNMHFYRSLTETLYYLPVLLAGEGETTLGDDGTSPTAGELESSHRDNRSGDNRPGFLLLKNLEATAPICTLD